MRTCKPHLLTKKAWCCLLFLLVDLVTLVAGDGFADVMTSNNGCVNPLLRSGTSNRVETNRFTEDRGLLLSGATYQELHPDLIPVLIRLGPHSIILDVGGGYAVIGREYFEIRGKQLYWTPGQPERTGLFELNADPALRANYVCISPYPPPGGVPRPKVKLPEGKFSDLRMTLAQYARLYPNSVDVAADSYAATVYAPLENVLIDLLTVVKKGSGRVFFNLDVYQKFVDHNGVSMTVEEVLSIGSGYTFKVYNGLDYWGKKRNGKVVMTRTSDDIWLPTMTEIPKNSDQEGLLATYRVTRHKNRWFRVPAEKRK